MMMLTRTRRWFPRTILSALGTSAICPRSSPAASAEVLLASAQRHVRRLVPALQARMPATLTVPELWLVAASLGAISRPSG